LRTDGDVNTPFHEEVESGLGDEASAEEKHPEEQNVSTVVEWRGTW
jgi:hypothetical protein